MNIPDFSNKFTDDASFQFNDDKTSEELIKKSEEKKEKIEKSGIKEENNKENTE